MRLLLLLLWFVFMASSLAWLPGYEGDVGGEEGTLLPMYGVIAGLAASSCETLRRPAARR
jgi:hypothetical protein